MTEQQTQLNQQKAEFEQKKADYLAKEPQLIALEAEKTKSENMKTALENELQEIIEKTKSALSAAKVLSADEYAELKTADFNIKSKIEYYQAVIEEQDEKIYQFKENLAKERKKLIYIRKLLFDDLADEIFKEFSEEIIEKLSDVFKFKYLSYSVHYSSLHNLNDPKDEAIEYIKTKILNLIDEKKPLSNDFVVKNLTSGFESKSPILKHRERVETEQGIRPKKGFERLIDDLTK